MTDQELLEQDYPLQSIERPQLPALLHEAITRPDTDLDKLERLIALKERLDAKEAQDAFLEAKAKFLGSFKEPIPCDKTGQVGNTKFRYASLGRILEHALPRMGRYGLSHSSEPDWKEGLVTVTLRHVLGHAESSSFPLSTEGQPQKATTDQQKQAHALTYAERQAFKAVSGVPVADEDVDATRPSPKATEGEIKMLKGAWWKWQKQLGKMTDETPKDEAAKAFAQFAGSLATFLDVSEAWKRLATAMQNMEGHDDASAQPEDRGTDHDRGPDSPDGDQDRGSQDEPRY